MIYAYKTQDIASCKTLHTHGLQICHTLGVICSHGLKKTVIFFARSHTNNSFGVYCSSCSIVFILILIDYRRYGVPTIRTDLPAPRIRRVDDRKNYGDESDAYGLVNPSVFSLKGVYEKDFLLPRSKEEVCSFIQICFILPSPEV